jgi:hypothetical protein
MVPGRGTFGPRSPVGWCGFVVSAGGITVVGKGQLVAP